jgi:hypothetical protein
MLDRKFFPKLSQETCDLAQKINEEAKRDPSSPFAGKFVGITNGTVIAMSDNLTEVFRRVRQEPDPQACCIVEASRDYDVELEVWPSLGSDEANRFFRQIKGLRS